MAELAVLQHFTEHILALEAAHRADDAICLGRDKSSVEAALPDMQAPYQYVWNYPLARLLAAKLVQKEHAMTAGVLFHEGAGGGTFLSRWMATPDEDCPAT